MLCLTPCLGGWLLQSCKTRVLTSPLCLLERLRWEWIIVSEWSKRKAERERDRNMGGDGKTEGKEGIFISVWLYLTPSWWAFVCNNTFTDHFYLVSFSLFSPFFPLVIKKKKNHKKLQLRVFKKTKHICVSSLFCNLSVMELILSWTHEDIVNFVSCFFKLDKELFCSCG